MLSASTLARGLTATRGPIAQRPYLPGLARLARSNFHTSIPPRNAASGATAVPLLINGREIKTGQPFDLKHPRTGEVVSHFHGASEQDLNDAVSGAKTAFRSWAALPAGKRRDILYKAANLIEERYESVLAPAYAKDTNVASIVFGTDKAYGVEHLKSAAALTTELKGEIPPTMDGSLALVTREPYGVILAISPFNFGITLGVRAFCYALACGNAVIWKANQQIPTLHYELCKIMHDAGVPKEVLQMVQFAPGTEPERTEQLIAHPDIKLVNFTGSIGVGSSIGALAGKYIKPALLELGGNAPAVILEDADLAMAANNIVFGGMLHSGHICMSTARIVVLESVADQLVSELEKIVAAEFKGLDRMRMANKAGVDKLHSLVADATSKGANLIKGVAVTPKDDEISHAPVILDRVDSSQDIYHQETFGPSLVVIRAKDVEDAIRIANDSDVGLSASVWGKDYKQCLDVAKRIESGAVHINSMTVHDEPNLPHGGMKNSGFGRFNGQAAGMQFTQTKCITMREPHMLPIAYIK